MWSFRCCIGQPTKSLALHRNRDPPARQKKCTQVINSTLRLHIILWVNGSHEINKILPKAKAFVYKSFSFHLRPSPRPPDFFLPFSAMRTCCLLFYFSNFTEIKKFFTTRLMFYSILLRITHNMLLKALSTNHRAGLRINSSNVLRSMLKGF